MAITFARATSKLQNRKPAVAVVSSLLTALFGVLLLLIVGARGLLDHQYRVEGREVAARVTGSSYAYSRGTSYHVVHYTFDLPDGRTFTGNQTGYSGTPGSSIPVYYLPSHPSFNRVAGSEKPEQKWLVVIAGAGAFLLIAGIQSWEIQRGKERRTARGDAEGGSL